MRRTIFASLALTAAAALPAANADEVWSTKVGDIIYEDEIGDFAVLSIPSNAQGDRAKAFILGLAGNYDQRYRFEGYWTWPEGDATCAVSIVDAEGNTSDHWGRIKIHFISPAYPTGFVLEVGSCFEEPDEVLVGLPVEAEPE